MGLTAPVVNGKVQISEDSQQTKERKTNDSLGKEDFLLLLVTQCNIRIRLNLQITLSM